jgi:hypothetical protein
MRPLNSWSRWQAFRYSVSTNKPESANHICSSTRCFAVAREKFLDRQRAFQCIEQRPLLSGTCRRCICAVLRVQHGALRLCQRFQVIPETLYSKYHPASSRNGAGRHFRRRDFFWSTLERSRQSRYRHLRMPSACSRKPFGSKSPQMSTRYVQLDDRSVNA